jgi:hypothetical protein
MAKKILTGLSIEATDSSSSASTGALVVSGGVGVSGAINVGGSLAVTSNATVAGTFRLSNTGDATLTSTTHAFQIGPSDSLNLRIDNNEILVASNGVANTLALQNDGGTVSIGGTGTANLTVSGTISIQGRKVSIQATEPASPAAGDVWIWY